MFPAEPQPQLLQEVHALQTEVQGYFPFFRFTGFLFLCLNGFRPLEDRLQPPQPLLRCV